MQLQITVFTHPGKCRKINEDCIAVSTNIFDGEMYAPLSFAHDFDEPVVLLIADGMGGHRSGEIASQWLANELGRTMNDPGMTKDTLAERIQASNRGMFEQMDSNPDLIGMGSTLVGIYYEGHRAVLFNVGDSRAYRLQDGFLAQLTIDDIFDRSAFGDAIDSAKTGRVTQAMGGSSEFMAVEPHLTELRLVVGDTFLLCSDGLTDMLSLDAMETALSSDLTATVQQLFNEAMNAGGSDNISIVLAKVI